MAKYFVSDEVNVCDIADHVRELEKKDLPGGDLRFSSLTSANNKGHAIQSPPFLDFIKSSFRFNIGRKFNPPFLKGVYSIHCRMFISFCIYSFVFV